MTKPTSIHDQIVTYLCEKYSGIDIRDRDIFYNQRTKGLRLSKIGLDLLKYDFDTYTFAIPKEVKVSLKHIKLLEENLQWPYYISQKQLVLLNEEDAVIFKLVDGYENWINGFQ